jgi:ribosomal protein L7/L12
MSKTSKYRRDSAKKARAKSKMAKKFQPKPQDIEPFRFTQLDNPMRGLTSEERAYVTKQLKETSEKKAADGLSDLANQLRISDPISLLSILAGYSQIMNVDDEGMSTDRSIFGVNQSQIELLQAIILTMMPEEMGDHAPTPEIISLACEKLDDISHGFAFSRLNSEVENSNANEAAIISIQEILRGSTQTIRNWGYHHQLTRISKSLYSSFDKKLQEKIGFTVSNMIDLFENHLKICGSKLEKYYTDFAMVRNEKNKILAVYKYHEILGLDLAQANSFIEKLNIKHKNIGEVKFILWSHYNLMMLDLFDLDLIEIENAANLPQNTARLILSYTSLKLGELHDARQEHFFLNNPVWNNPVIELPNQRFICPIPYLFFSFITSISEHLIEQYEKPKLHERRAKFLEQYIEEIVKRRFPESLTVSGVEWVIDDRKYETDLITFIDSHVLIIEAKSQKFTDRAWRGSVDRIRRHVNEILIEPNLQSERFANRLQFLIDNPEEEDNLRRKLPVSLEKIHKVIRLSVSLESLGVLQSNIALIEKAGWLPDGFVPCPNISLADFETLFDLLESPIMILHYLQRRTELPNEIHIQGDELDLMGMYLDTLFDLGDIGSTGAKHIYATGASRRIDNFYSTFNENNQLGLVKPRPKINPFFERIIDALAERATPRWTEIGIALNRISPFDQIKIVKAIRDLEGVVKKKWNIQGHKNMFLYVPHNSSNYALAYVMYTNGNASQRDAFVNSAISYAAENRHVKYCLIIAKNIELHDRPYHFIAMAEMDDKFSISE